MLGFGQKLKRCPMTQKKCMGMECELADTYEGRDDDGGATVTQACSLKMGPVVQIQNAKKLNDVIDAVNVARVQSEQISQQNMVAISHGANAIAKMCQDAVNMAVAESLKQNSIDVEGS